MASLLASKRPFAAPVALLSLKPLRRLVMHHRADRARRKALMQLMGLDDARLEDIGLSREDVRRAIRTRPRSLGEVFAARRASRAERSLLG